MTATLTFNLPEEEHEHGCAVSGGKAIGVLCDLDQLLRKYVKYEAVPEHIKTPIDCAELIREELHDMTVSAGLTELLNS